MQDAPRAGQGLLRVLGAQRVGSELVRFPDLERLACALVTLSRDLGDPIVWPTGSDAEQLAGAATLLSRGEVRVLSSSDDLIGERVLVMTVAALTALPLLIAADRAKLRGAAEVYGCGVRVDDLEAVAENGLIGYFRLGVDTGLDGLHRTVIPVRARSAAAIR